MSSNRPPLRIPKGEPPESSEDQPKRSSRITTHWKVIALILIVMITIPTAVYFATLEFRTAPAPQRQAAFLLDYSQPAATYLEGLALAQNSQYAVTFQLSTFVNSSYSHYIEYVKVYLSLALGTQVNYSQVILSSQVGASHVFVLNMSNVFPAAQEIAQSQDLTVSEISFQIVTSLTSLNPATQEEYTLAEIPNGNLTLNSPQGNYASFGALTMTAAPLYIAS